MKTTPTPAPVLFYVEGTCALGALTSLVWLDQPFYVCRLEKDDAENQDYLALNGLGEVPTLFINGTVITENSAILQHIGLRDLSKKLMFRPGTPESDQFNRALGFLASSFHKSFMPVLSPGTFSDDPQIQSNVKQYAIDHRLKDMFAYANEHLLRTTFMYEHPMVIDAYLFAMARWANDIYDYAKDFPHFDRFMKAMNENAGVKKALQIETAKLKEPQGSFLGELDFKKFVAAAAGLKQKVDRIHHDGEYTPRLSQEHAQCSQSQGKPANGSSASA